MADSYGLGSFAFRCLVNEADVLVEAIRALNDIMMEDEPEPPSDAMAAIVPPSRADEPWSGLVDLMPDPDFPGINADYTSEIAPDDPTIAIVCFSSMVDFEPLPIAELIYRCCRETLKVGPVGFEWAATCSRPRLDEFGGGWCVIFADRIEIENTGHALSRALASWPSTPPILQE